MTKERRTEPNEAALTGEIETRTTFDRRQVLLLAAAAAMSSTARLVFAETPSESLNEIFDSFMIANLDASPEETTSLGLDTGGRAWTKTRLDERTLASIARKKERVSGQLKRMLAFDRASLSGMDRVNYDVVLFCLQSADAANKRHDYGPGDGAAPYVVSPLTGAYGAIPNFLDGQHQVASRAGADAYLLRLAAFATALDQEIEVVRHDAGLGCLPPDFALAKTLDQMVKLRSVEPLDAGLVTSVARRAKEQRIPGDYAGEAAKIVSEKVYPALDRQIALVKEMQARATPDGGIWKLKNGDEYYADTLVAWTASPLSPSEIHKLGLGVVADTSARIGEILKRQGMTQGTVGERVRALFNDPKFRYPNTEAGKNKLLADLNAKVQAIRARLPQYFGVLPKADVVAKRVPPYMEAAQPRGYYQPPSLDGKRPGAFFVNLRDTAETPSWTLPAHTYHQSLPGHHVRFSVYQEANLPLLRKLLFYSIYLEGWSLYAEQLADEMGLYDDNPFSRIGYLHGALRAAVALVIDTGMHALRWSRERGIEYFTAMLGDPVASATTEVERYCIWPGQVCSYTLDNLTILRLRDKAKAALGARFDIRRFHDAVLLCGPAPQKVLETVVDNYIGAKPGRTGV